MKRAALPFALLLFLAPLIHAAEDPQLGQFTLTLTERAPASDPVKICGRTGWTLSAIKRQLKDPSEIEYDLTTESFEVYIPKGYNGDSPFGLFVWVSASNKGDVQANWKEVLDKHKLIWIGANNSGNPRTMLVRMGLAFDAVAGMKKKYKIDDQRIYVGGGSGGGKIATILGVAFPDVFRGGFYFVGSDCYRNVPTKEIGHYWPKAFNAPPGQFLIDSKKRSRHVFLTGEKDFNRDSTKDFAAAYKSDGSQHVTLSAVRKMGHQLPDAEWLEKGIIARDEIPAPATKPAKPSTRLTPSATKPL